jgi:pimeloyl-ACP methyl ester carboxylesterase
MTTPSTRRHHRRLTGTAAATLLLGAACVGSNGGDTPEERAAPPPTTAAADHASLAAPQAGGLEWSDCREEALIGLECATLEVPLDHRDPAGGRMAVAVARLAATDPAGRIGSLVLNPGGPGVSGVDFLAGVGSGFPDEVRQRFDLVSFDPRGAGRSAGVRCEADGDALAALDGDPETPQERADNEAAVALVTAACIADHRDLLPHLGTGAAARDLDLLRAALGDAQLSYLGFSYGTKLGATYASLFPDRVRAMVLDGAMAPDADPRQGSRHQAIGFERAYGNFITACSQDPACPGGANVAAVAERVRQRAEQGPIPVSLPGEDRPLAIGNLQIALVSALYDQFSWWMLARGVVEADRGDGTTLLHLADAYTERQPDGSYAPTLDAMHAINCADTVERTASVEPEAWRAEMVALAPHFGAMMAEGLNGCSSWPAPAEPPVAIAAPEAPPIVVVGTTGDPATPYESAGELAAALGDASLVTWEGEGHTAYFSAPCVTRAANRYLLELELPADGLRCPADAAAQAMPFTAYRDVVVKAYVDGRGLTPDVAACVADRLIWETSVHDWSAAPSPAYLRQIDATVAACQGVG